MQRIIVIPIIVVALLLGACGKSPTDYNVVLISLDTTRSDYVDTGGGAKAFTPELKRFSRKSIVFERAYCTIPQTLPSHLSILTSYFPQECGVYSNQYQYDHRFKMLQQVLKEKRYITAGVISLGTLSSSTGIAEGFDHFLENLNEDTVFFTPAERVTHEGLQLLDKIKKEKFFLFLHYSDPHSPYAPPRVNGCFKIEVDGKPEVQFNSHQGAILRKHIQLAKGTHQIHFKVENHSEDFEAFVIRRLAFSKNCSTEFQNIEYSKTHYNGAHVLKGKEGMIRIHCSDKGFVKIFQVIPLLTWKAAIKYYRLEVEYMDRFVGKFIEKLEKEKLLDKTIVVITGDHGEGLGERERYFGHVRYLNRQFIEVPLIMHLPGIKAKRITMPVSLIGISPTLLELMGIQDHGFNYQHSLLPVITSQNGRNASKRTVYSFAFSPSAAEDKHCVIRWPYQCIFVKDITGTTTSETYNLLLSQSFRKLDEFSPDVLMRHSRKDYLALWRASRQINGALGKQNIARLKIKSHEGEIEKLKTMGYLH